MVETAIVETTQDGFLDNGFQVLQPAQGGHRSGLDALLLAATVPQGSGGRCADLGSGAGVAGLAAAHRCPQLRVALVEQDSTMAELARQTLSLSANNHLVNRAMVIECDVTLSGQSRENSGLPSQTFQHVIANPPFNDSHAMQVSPNALRGKAHQAEAQDLSAWVRTARAISRPRASVTFILRAQNLGVSLSAFSKGLGSVSILPIHPKADAPASRILVSGILGSSAPLALLPPLVIHETNGRFTSRADAIFRGQGSIDLNRP